MSSPAASIRPGSADHRQQRWGGRPGQLGRSCHPRRRCGIVIRPSVPSLLPSGRRCRASVFWAAELLALGFEIVGGRRLRGDGVDDQDLQGPLVFAVVGAVDAAGVFESSPEQRRQAPLEPPQRALDVGWADGLDGLGDRLAVGPGPGGGLGGDRWLDDGAADGLQVVAGGAGLGGVDPLAKLAEWLAAAVVDAPMAEDDTERAQVFLTNALTGWEPEELEPLPIPELEQERDQADHVKQDTPILVILGNPPYNGFAGVTIDEEGELPSSEAPQAPRSAVRSRVNRGGWRQTLRVRRGGLVPSGLPSELVPLLVTALGGCNLAGAFIYLLLDPIASYPATPYHVLRRPPGAVSARSDPGLEDWVQYFPLLPRTSRRQPVRTPRPAAGTSRASVGNRGTAREDGHRPAADPPPGPSVPRPGSA